MVEEGVIVVRERWGLEGRGGRGRGGVRGEGGRDSGREGWGLEVKEGVVRVGC